MDSKDFIHIDDKTFFDLNHFSIPFHYVDDLENVLIPHGLVLDRVEKLANLIYTDFLKSHQNTKEGLVAICILKGGHQFFADLIRAIKKLNASHHQSVPISLEFLRVKSYHNDASTGEVDIMVPSGESWQDLNERFKGKHLLIVEDIIDTGKTMEALLKKMKQMDLGSIKITSLFLKRTSHSSGYVPDYVGFSIPNQFIVGYCLDYNEYFRDLDHVCVINQKGKVKYQQ